MTRFTCVSSSGEAGGGGGGGGQWRIGCSLGCLCWKDSSNEEGSVRRRSKGMCCLQKSTGESYREERGRCCSSCGKWSKGKCGLRCLHCFHCQRSSEEEEESRKRGKCPCPFCRKSKEESALVEKQRCWKSCFCRNKSSSEEETARRRGKCGMGCFFCCNKSPKTEEPSRKREKCGMCFLCCEKSPKEEEPSRKRGKCETGCFRCTKSSSEEFARKRNGWWTCCFCCNKSSTKGEETRGGEEKAKGCFHCDYFSSCCKSSKEEESRRRGEKATCCCYRKRTTGSGSSPRRGCAKNFGCNSCCSKPACKKKIRCSRTLCWKRKENKQPNHLASLVESISFKSDSGGRQRSAVEEILRIGNGNIAARVFTYRQLTAATQNFNPECLLGTGGFGKVYKGQLEDTKEIVAVKQLDRQGYQGNREFLIEVLMLSLLDHENLVNLLGYCAAGNERILVYEFMALGSLQDHLHDLSPNRKPLDWITRMKIAAGAARGLEYLHDRANPPVIYRDLKASNILLDKDFTPKLSDFGLAKLGPVGEQKHVSTRVMGTYGYCAPEYVRTGKLTKMSDVYSFGVLLLEIITGRKPMDKTRPPSEQVLLEWAAPLVQDKKKFVELADPLLEGKFPVKALYQALAIASVCLQENSSTRPVVMDIVIALEFLAAQNSCNQEEPEASTAQNSLP